MGNKTSKKSKDTSARTYTTELRSYEAACKEDMEIQHFDTRMKARTSRVMNTLGTGVEDRKLSFDSLKVVTETLVDMNQEVVKVISDSKKDIWKDQEMFELVQDYLETTVTTVEFCDALEGGLQGVRRSHLLILGALQQFEEEILVHGGNGYKKTLEELNKFKDAESPFGEVFFKMFQSVYKQQMVMLEKLQLRRNKLGKKFKRIRIWRKLSGIIFVTTCASLLIFSVVAAAMAAPPMAAPLAFVAAMPLIPLGEWVDSLWKNYEKALKWQKEVISSMQAVTYVAIKDFDNIRVLIEQLETEVTGMVKSAELEVDHNAVKIGIDAIKKKLEVFRKNVEELGIQTNLCSRDIRRARTEILQKICKKNSVPSS